MGFDEVDRDWASPLGVIVGVPISSEQHRKCMVCATFKNGCAFTALGWILPALWGWGFGGSWQHVFGKGLIAGGLRMMLGPGPGRATHAPARRRDGQAERSMPFARTSRR
jgi:hypothetical protein